MVAEASSHCGSGCTLGDICAESLFSCALGRGLARLGFDFLAKNLRDLDPRLHLRNGFGIIFQYYTIAPMRHLGVAQGTWAAIKADTLSLTAWQVCMYGFMAVAHFWIFHHLLGLELKADMPEFWSTMQVAMIFGFLTSYPVNWWLLRTERKRCERRWTPPSMNADLFVRLERCGIKSVGTRRSGRLRGERQV